MAPISLPPIFHLFSPQEGEKQHRNFYAPSARSGPRLLRGGVRRQGIPWWVSPVTHQPQDLYSSERHYFRMSFTGPFLWYVSWGLLSIDGHWIRDVVQYTSVYSLLGFLWTFSPLFFPFCFWTNWYCYPPDPSAAASSRLTFILGKSTVLLFLLKHFLLSLHIL